MNRFNRVTLAVLFISAFALYGCEDLVPRPKASAVRDFWL